MVSVVITPLLSVLVTTTGTTDKVARVPGVFPADTAATDQGWEDNKALVLDQVGAGEWDTGDGELDITCFYYTIANPSA
jgi:hypothetical protein